MTDLVRGLAELVQVILDASIKLIVWLIDLEIGTWVCVVTEMIQGVLDAIEGVLGELTKVPVVSKLISGISGLENDIPNATDITADAKAVISLPLSTIKTLLDESLGNWTMDSSLLPTAKKEELDFYSNDEALAEFFDVLFTIAKNAQIIAVTSLVSLAIFAAVFMAWWEIKRYQRTAKRVHIYRKREPMDVAYMASRPLTARTGLWIAEKVSSDLKRQMLVRWCVAYATTYTALFVLSIAVTGAFSVLCQFLLMRAIQKEAPVLSSKGGTFVKEVVEALERVSATWSNETNQAIFNVQSDINHNVFKYAWGAADAINDTIKVIEDRTYGFIDNVLRSQTAIDNAVTSMLDCFMDKLGQVQDALTWIHSHARASFLSSLQICFRLGSTMMLPGINPPP